MSQDGNGYLLANEGNGIFAFQGLTIVLRKTRVFRNFVVKLIWQKKEKKNERKHNLYGNCEIYSYKSWKS